jgi:hypothetical protein
VALSTPEEIAPIPLSTVAVPPPGAVYTPFKFTEAPCKGVKEEEVKLEMVGGAQAVTVTVLVTEVPAAFVAVKVYVVAALLGGVTIVLELTPTDPTP